MPRITEDDPQPESTAGAGKPPEPSIQLPSGVEIPDDRELGFETQGTPDEPEPQLADRIKELVIGKPRDLQDQRVFHNVSLVAFLAWVGLGADGLSSSCYGPAEAFINLTTAQGDFTYLAIFLSLATIMTLLVISACYSHIIEAFPAGGGGYLVASKLLGHRVGVVSGSALLVDYVLTVTVSISAAGDALFGFVGPEWQSWKLAGEFAAIGALIVLNLRGIRETIKLLLPIFLLFLVTHAILIFGTIGLHLPNADQTAREIGAGINQGLNNPAIGFIGLLALSLRAYSLGAGTYTGIEAVSNSMPVMREPRVQTAKHTMLYMALSLSITAGGLMVAYLLLGLKNPPAGKTMNFLLTERFVGDAMGAGWMGDSFLWATIISEGALLWVAAQAGFIDGPRILANLAQDSWAPHSFASLSERLAAHNGIVLMGGAALAALWLTDGNVGELLVMYSINVFLTFSLSMIGMCRHWYQLRGQNPLWHRRLALFLMGAVFCLSILGVTIYEKFDEGGWRTLLVTAVLISMFFATHHYYDVVRGRLHKLDDTLGKLAPPDRPPNTSQPDPAQATAAILVGGYSGIGVHTMLGAIRFAPGYYKNLVFISVGVVDSGNFKGAHAVDDLRRYTAETLGRYVTLAQKLGMPSTSYMAISTDAVDELEKVCLEVKKDFPQATFFAGRLMFQRDAWYQRLFHNRTAYLLQHRLQWDGVPMVILPTRVR